MVRLMQPNYVITHINPLFFNYYPIQKILCLATIFLFLKSAALGRQPQFHKYRVYKQQPYSLRKNRTLPY